ncbi:MAG: gliding motility-associated C-terminal domain-containing protein [Deferribacteres bacterium]|nr:gliding motility-associated C-terminal domain-containing protein [candidate division KSB1 bacterium]MCB9501861.1 gliding motility-associated C-terminal domain-containing protein [Deferribacteres bacterium]
MKTHAINIADSHGSSLPHFRMKSFLILMLSAGFIGAFTTPTQAFQLPAKVWISGPDSALAPSIDFNLNFNVGTNQDPVNDLFGISFELRYSSSEFLEFVDPFEIHPGGFLLPDVYLFMRHEPENGIIYLAISRKRGAPEQSGSGELFSLPFRFADNAPEKWRTCFVITGIFANDSNGNQIHVDAGETFCVQVREPQLDVLPNPFTPNGDGKNDDLIFEREGGIPENWVITIMDRAGRIIRKLTDGEDRWNGRDSNGALVLPGAYLYIIRDGNEIIRRGVLGIIR